MTLRKDTILTITDDKISFDKEIKIYEYDTANLCFIIQKFDIVIRNGKMQLKI